MATKTTKYFGIKFNKLKDPDDEIPKPLLKVRNKTWVNKKYAPFLSEKSVSKICQFFPSQMTKLAQFPSESQILLRMNYN